MTLPVLLLLALGVRVAVQWILSLLVRLLRVPLDADMSVRPKPLTASLKVMFTVELGRTVSMVKLLDEEVPVPGVPVDVPVTPVLSRTIWLVALVTLAFGVKVAM